jgi:hypothetical protein
MYVYKKRKLNLVDQRKIGEIVQAKKQKYEADKNDPTINKAVWNEKKRKWVRPFNQIGYIQPAVREIFIDLADGKSHEKEFLSATKFVVRCLEKLEKGDYDIEGNNTKSKLRLMGAGAPKRALEVRSALFDYFVDIRSTLKGRLPRFILQAKAKELYDTYREIKERTGEKPEELKLTDKWLDSWCKDYCISLKHPNKRFSVSHDVRKRRIIQFLQNVWRTRYWWLAKYKVDPPVSSLFYQRYYSAWLSVFHIIVLLLVSTCGKSYTSTSIVLTCGKSYTSTSIVLYLVLT